MALLWLPLSNGFLPLSAKPFTIPCIAHPPSHSIGMQTTRSLRSRLAFPRERLARPARCNLCTQSCTKHDTLRDIYTIRQPPDIHRTVLSALASSRNFQTFLQRHPIADHNRKAFEFAQKWRRRTPGLRPLCLDSGCGLGRSTMKLAKLLPHCDVIGIDKSASRLERTVAYRRDSGLVNALPNALLLRADLVDFWTLCLQNGVFLEHHFLLYPNPYPKPKHLKWRWHGHAIFPAIVALGGRVEVRGSWDSYLQEFQAAFSALHATDVLASLRGPENDQLLSGLVCPLLKSEDSSTALHDQPLTHFEEKYIRVRQPLFRLCIDTRSDSRRKKCNLRTI